MPSLRGLHRGVVLTVLLEVELGLLIQAVVVDVPRDYDALGQAILFFMVDTASLTNGSPSLGVAGHEPDRDLTTFTASATVALSAPAQSKLI